MAAVSAAEEPSEGGSAAAGGDYAADTAAATERCELGVRAFRRGDEVRADWRCTRGARAPRYRLKSRGPIA